MQTHPLNTHQCQPCPAAHHQHHLQDYGKYGVLRDTDRANKGAEFMLWAMDEQKVNPELLGPREEKELWEQYREEYNTGTLPHKWAGWGGAPGGRAGP